MRAQNFSRILRRASASVLRHYRRSLRRVVRKSLSQWAGATLLAVTLSLGGGATTLQAADEAFVGVLALAVDPKVAKELALSDEIREKLGKLIDERENEALELALELKDLQPAERAAKLQPFVLASEEKGLALLDFKQRLRLKQLKIERAGLSTLADPKVAEAVGLSEEQRTQVGKLMEQRTTAMAAGGEQERRLALNKFERDLAAVLSADQRKAWDRLAGLTATSGGAVAAEKTTEDMPTTGDKPADAKPASDKPAEKGVASAEKPGDKPSSKGSESMKPGEKFAGTSSKSADGKLYFKFRFAPWKDVLDWLATQADMSLLADQSPPGTFNYTDTRGFTPSESIDLVNGALLLKGYMLIRRERQLILLNLEDPIPDPLIDLISVKELDARGRYELLTVVLPFTKWSPEEAEKEIAKLISPNLGKVNVLPQARQLIVRDTVSRLKVIRDVVQTVDNPPPEREEKIEVLKFEHLTVEDFIAQARPLLGLPENTLQVPDGSLKLALDPANKRILATGKSERIEKLLKLKTLLDDPSTAAPLAPPEIVEQAQLEVYTTNGADPTAVREVISTLFAGQTDIRVATDPKTGNLVALAKPSQHATIRATLDQMQRDANQVEVFTLRRVDPQVVVLAINKLFGVDEKDGKSPGNSAPRVESDTTSRQLFIRGTPSQVAQVKSLLTKMGESDTSTSTAASGDPQERGGNIRTLPLSGRTARTVLEEAEALWPVMRPNRIRVVRPSGDGPQLKTRGDAPAESTRKPGAEETRGVPSTDKPTTKPQAPPPPAKLPAPPRNARRLPDERKASVAATWSRAELLKLVAWQDPAAPGATEKPATPAKPNAAAPAADVPATEKPSGDKPGAETPPADKPSAEKPSAEKPPADPTKPRRFTFTPKTAGPNANPLAEPAEIVVIVGPRDITIACEDLDALDEFEDLLRMFADRAYVPGGEPTVFYLRFATADAAANLLQEVMSGSGGDAGGGGGGGGSLFGDIASSMMGDMGGGLLGSLLGGGGGGAAGGGSLGSSTALSIIPDSRLNALFVKAGPTDLEMIEQLLKIIDQEGSPEDPQTSGKPRFIQVYNTSADKVATIVKQVFASRITADATQPRQPSPEDLVRALRGGGGGRQNSRQQAKSEPAKMTIGVDSDSNSLIVAAPEPLYQEVKTLVEELDHQAVANRDESMQMVKLKGTSPAVMQRALQSLLGPNVKVNSGSATGAAGGMNPAAAGQGNPFGGANIPGGGRPPGGGQIVIPQIPGGGFPGGFPGGGIPGGGNRGGGPGGGGGGRGGRGGGGFQ